MQVTLCLPQGYTVREEGEVHKQQTAVKMVTQGDTVKKVYTLLSCHMSLYDIITGTRRQDQSATITGRSSKENGN